MKIDQDDLTFIIAIVFLILAIIFGLFMDVKTSEENTPDITSCDFINISDNYYIVQEKYNVTDYIDSCEQLKFMIDSDYYPKKLSSVVSEGFWKQHNIDSLFNEKFCHFSESTIETYLQPDDYKKYYFENCVGVN